jgi:hypothetical protein
MLSQPAVAGRCDVWRWRRRRSARGWQEAKERVVYEELFLLSFSPLFFQPSLYFCFSSQQQRSHAMQQLTIILAINSHPICGKAAAVSLERLQMTKE